MDVLEAGRALKVFRFYGSDPKPYLNGPNSSTVFSLSGTKSTLPDRHINDFIIPYSIESFGKSAVLTNIDIPSTGTKIMRSVRAPLCPGDTGKDHNADEAKLDKKAETLPIDCSSLMVK